MGAFSTPLSGLMAAQQQLQAVSNNLANIDTDGYKSQNLTFSDIFLQTGITNGNGDPEQIGSGVAVSSTDSDFSTEGNLAATGTDSNMAVSGNGFFITQETSGAQDYTRAGDFTTNNSGQLVTPSGDLVLGYPAVAGVVNTSSALQPLQVGSMTSPAVASTMIGITANLDSNTAAGASAPSSTQAIYDSLGQAHTLTVNYTMNAPGNWTYTVTMPSADVTAGTTGDTTVGNGTLVFLSNGQLDTTNSVIGQITIPTLADGAAVPQNINGPFGTTADPTITQTAMASSTSATTTDGFAPGTLTSFTVQPDGTIQGTFTSGNTLALGQVAVASFANNQGLTSIGNNNYQATNASGTAVIGEAGTGGRGTIVGGSVEQSNVDIATEFSKLIVAQQAYSANAKSITTFNTLSQATLAMIQ
ncbi:MAG: flagellar hook protein FlgE [Terracidiphilus sp.]|jgi:flagellar hook protein FlgE